MSDPTSENEAWHLRSPIRNTTQPWSKQRSNEAGRAMIRELESLTGSTAKDLDGMTKADLSDYSYILKRRAVKARIEIPQHLKGGSRNR